MHYTLMHKTAPVLRLAIDEDTGVVLSIEELFAPEHLPVGIPCTNGVADRQALNSWWTGRAIPASRAGLRDALETLAVPAPQLLLTKCYGLSLSDQYWVCPENSGLRWENINFFDNEFSPDVGNILFGHAPAREAISLLSPDNTSDGWLRKRWKIVAGKRCLIKGGSNPFQQEPLGEALASAVMQRLRVAHVPYSVTWMDEKPYSICEDFVTSQTDLVSAWHIMQTQKRENHVSKWQHYLHCCDALGIPGVRESLNQMLTVDFIIANEDRHFNNFGALRNAETLDWQGAAPIFDCGTSLWFDKTAAQITHRNAPSKPFRSDHAEQIKLVTSFDWLDMSALRGIDEEFHAILQGSAFIEPARAGALCIALRKRVELLGDVLRVQNRHKEDHAR